MTLALRLAAVTAVMSLAWPLLHTRLGFFSFNLVYGAQFALCVVARVARQDVRSARALGDPRVRARLACGTRRADAVPLE